MKQTKDDYNLDQPDPMMEIALFQGLAQNNYPLKPMCSTSSCIFPDFTTLEFCSQRVDVTESSSQTCILPEGGLHGSYTSPSGLQITPETSSISGSPSENLIQAIRYPLELEYQRI